ncbi:NYN domain-containing protein [bacterium]|nr:NYN domain-containing protein [bacterium]
MNMEKCTERSRGFLQAAQTIAMREGHQRVLPEHLLKALMDDDQGLSANLIKRAGGASEAELLTLLLFAERARDAGGYRRGQENFCSVLRDFGYKVVQRDLAWREDESGNRFLDAGCTTALAIDALDQADGFDRILLVAGAPELVVLVRALQSRGCRVEVVGFEDTSPALRAEADLFLPAQLIPNLLPIPGQSDREAWGRVGGKARGVCYNHSGKGYGFLRYLQEVGPGIWITDSRHPDSPFETVFFHDSQLPRNVAFHELPSRSHVFEFELVESDRFDDDVQAIHLRLVSGTERRATAEDDRADGDDDEWEGRGGERDDVYSGEFGEKA